MKILVVAAPESLPAELAENPNVVLLDPGQLGDDMIHALDELTGGMLSEGGEGALEDWASQEEKEHGMGDEETNGMADDDEMLAQPSATGRGYGRGRGDEEEKPSATGRGRGRGDEEEKPSATGRGYGRGRGDEEEEKPSATGRGRGRGDEEEKPSATGRGRGKSGKGGPLSSWAKGVLG